MSRFAPRRPGDVARLVQREVLALVVTQGDDGSFVSPLPLLPEFDDEQRIVALIGHFARGNPHLDALARRWRALVIFLGPHGYVPPAAVSRQDWAPTWVYQLAWFETEIELLPDRSDAHIRSLVKALEGDDDEAWTVDAVGARYEGMVKNVVGFRARVIREHARFKLGQDETPASFGEIVSYLQDDGLLQAMREQAAGD